MQIQVLFLTLFWIGLIVPAGLFFPGILPAEDQRARSSRDLSTADKVKVYLEVGTRYQDTRQWEKAMKTYEQALELDPFNVSTHRQIMKFYFDWHKHAWVSGGVPTGPIREKAIESLYKIQVLAPASQENKEMMDWAYKMFVEHVKYFRWWVHRKGNANNPKENDLLAAENVLQQQVLVSQNLEFQCQLGLTRSILARLYKNKDNGEDILREAVGVAPKNGFCHESLAMALDMDTVEKKAEALHEYVLAIQFLKGTDEGASQHRSSLATRGVSVFAQARERTDRGQAEELPKFSSIDLPMQKTSEILKFFIDNNSENHRFADGGSTVFPVVWLGNLYFEMGNYRLAEETFFEHAQKTYQDQGLSQEVLERWIEALEKGGHNPERLAEVRKKYEEKYGESSKGPATKYRR